jgi:hypothetical protein
MKNISWWARKHVWASRIGILIIYVIITLLAVSAGNNLNALNIHISDYLLASALLLFILGALFYPVKKQKNNYPFNFYTRQKLCDSLLGFSTFLVVSFVVDAPHHSFSFVESIRGASIISIPADLTRDSNSLKDARKLPVTFRQTKAQRKALLKELKAVLRQSLHNPRVKDLNSGTRITLVVFSIIGAVGLSALLAGLACNIACTGSGTLAVFVAVFGAVAIATLLIVTIRAIYHRYPKVLVPVSENPPRSSA